MGRNVMKTKLGMNGSKPNLGGGFNKSSGTRPADFTKTPWKHSDWAGTTKGATKHTYKEGR